MSQLRYKVERERETKVAKKVGKNTESSKKLVKKCCILKVDKKVA